MCFTKQIQNGGRIDTGTRRTKQSAVPLTESRKRELYGEGLFSEKACLEDQNVNKNKVYLQEVGRNIAGSIVTPN
jgi:hypothetical protein